VTATLRLLVAIGVMHLVGACSSHSGDSRKVGPSTDNAGSSGEQQPGPEPPVQPAVGVEDRAEPGPAGPAATATCAAIADRFRQTLAGASGTCAAATDCDCYNPVIA
jgi:hypothetical protein